MSGSESIAKSEAIGQLFGLFGCDDNKKEEEEEDIKSQTEEGEIIEREDNFVRNSEQNIEINENECIICESKQIKYRCPKCQSKTCSLNCCKIHKTRLNCNGIRDKLSFVKISDFTQSEFLSDYFFLEDVDRILECSARERRSIISSKTILPKWLQKMVREARLRGINLKIMPAGFKRRKQNTTCFMYNQKTINWDIELKFIHALDNEVKPLDQLLDEDLVTSYSEISYLKSRVCENTKLLSLILEYIEDNKNDKKLFLYQKLGIDAISVLFRDECHRNGEQKYFEFDLNKTIKQNLFRKTVIEFPTLLVVLNKFKHLFDISVEKVVKNI